MGLRPTKKDHRFSLLLVEHRNFFLQEIDDDEFSGVRRAEDLVSKSDPAAAGTAAVAAELLIEQRQRNRCHVSARLPDGVWNLAAVAVVLTGGSVPSLKGARALARRLRLPAPGLCAEAMAELAGVS